MGRESTKANQRRLADPFWHRVFSGRGIDIGAGDDLVTHGGVWPNVHTCESFDVSDGDATHITRYRDPESFDFVYSSHCLEHLRHPRDAIREWWRLVKYGGYLVVVVPDEDLYEQQHWPSVYNIDHKWTFTIFKAQGESWSPRSISVVPFLIENLWPFRLLWLRLADSQYNYCVDGVDQTGHGAEAGIEFVVQKPRN